MPVEVKVTRERGDNKIAAAVDNAVEAIVKKEGAAILAAVKEEAPSESGDMIKGLKLLAVGRFGPHRFFVRIRSTASYFDNIIFGHKGFTIRAKLGGALAFMFPAVSPNPRSHDGKALYKKVEIPPRKPNNFVKRAVRRILPQLTKKAATTFITFIKR